MNSSPSCRRHAIRVTAGQGRSENRPLPSAMTHSLSHLAGGTQCDPARTVTDAADAFLARSTATTTRRSYGQTMSALTTTYGGHALEVLDGPTVARLAADRWGAFAPATWNRHVATLRSFAAFCHRRGWFERDPVLAWSGARRKPTGPRPSPTPPWSGCFAARTSRSARSASGGCCTNQPPARRKSSPSTWRTSTWTTSALAAPPKAATRDVAALPVRLSPPVAPAHRRAPNRADVPGRPAPRPPAPPPPWTCARPPAEDGCPTNAPSTCSSAPPGGSASTGLDAAPAPALGADAPWPTPTSTCPC